MNEEFVRKTEEFLRQKLSGGAYMTAHPDALAYRLAHTFRVANIGREIARQEGFDETEMVVACLLHDVSYCEDFGEEGWREHGRRSARIARPFLRELALPEGRVNEICFGIAIHVDDEADFPGERTPLALSVSDADNLDRIDVYRIHEALSLDGFLGMGLEEKIGYVGKKLDRLRSWRDLTMGTKTAEKLWEDRLSFSIEFYERLLAQLRNSAGCVRTESEEKKEGKP